MPSSDFLGESWATRETPVYMSATRVAESLGLFRTAVYNAYQRGAIKAAAFVDETPVFDEQSVLEWRRGIGRHRTPQRSPGSGRRPKA